MPILAVTLGSEEGEQPVQAAADSAAVAVVLPFVSEAMRQEVMHLIWANFEVCCDVCSVSVVIGILLLSTDWR